MRVKLFFFLNQKTEEATGDQSGNDIANKITKSLKRSEQSNLETVTNEHHQEIAKERYISSKESQKILDDLRLI